MNSNQKKKLATHKTSNASNSEKIKTNKEISKVSKSKANKKIWSVEALIESMKPSSEELEYREKKLKENDILPKGSPLFQCTKCLANFNDRIRRRRKIPTHPILGVLMCVKCCNYYEDGEFSLDSDGEDKYCRWCGEGGTIFSCANCICGFCASCVKRHFKLDFFKKVQRDDNWLCFFCNPKPLWFLRFICSQAINAAKGLNKSSSKLSTSKGSEDINNDQSSSPNNLSSNCSSARKKNSFRKRIFICSSDESESETETQEPEQKKLKLVSNSPSSSSKERETESLKNIKFNALKEIEKVLKLSEYQLRFGANWSNKVIKKLGSAGFLSTNKNLANECQKIKWFLSLLSTYLVQYCNSLNSLEQTLLKEGETKISSDVQDKNESPYISILQFLGFVNSQIKTFMEKGINLSDLLEAEVYDDENIIGIKKKLNSLSDSFKGNKKNFTFNANDETENNESSEELKLDNESSEFNTGTDEDKIDSESRDKVENGLYLTGDQNSEIYSAEYDKENSSVSAALGINLKGSDTEEDIQEILAILENA